MRFLFHLDLNLHADAGKKFRILILGTKHGLCRQVSRGFVVRYRLVWFQRVTQVGHRRADRPIRPGRGASRLLAGRLACRPLTPPDSPRPAIHCRLPSFFWPPLRCAAWRPPTSAAHPPPGRPSPCRAPRAGSAASGQGLRGAEAPAARTSAALGLGAAAPRQPRRGPGRGGLADAALVRWAP